MNIPPPIKKRDGRGGLVGPLILIGAGIILLLNNFGILGWEIWESLFRLWPIILIAVGLDIIIRRRSVWGSLAVAVIFVGLVVGGLYFLGVGTPVSGQPVTTETISQGLENATRAEVTLASGIGNLQLGTTADANLLISGTIALNPPQRINRDFRVTGDTAYFSLREVSAGAPDFGVSRGRVWDLLITRAVPVKLEIKGGVGNATLDLVNAQISDVSLNAGIGNNTVTLPERGKYSAKIDGGIGNVIVNIPQNVGARIRVRSGLGAVNVGERFVKQGDLYVSANFDSAENRVELDVSGGIGNVNVQTQFATK